ncbi:MAG: ethanolamine utilization protein EutJ [Verrucomicrobia bacterium]|nr:MAG: ethanolamine utilization protein EutJ [Verrucomicrobiota bacterium]
MCLWTYSYSENKRTIAMSVFCSIFIFLYAILVLTGIASCKKPPLNRAEVPVGALLPLTGRDSLYGREALRGLEIALKQINLDRAVYNLKPIRLVIRDTQSKEGETSVVVRDLIYRQGVRALIGEPDSGRSMEAAPIAERSGIPFISPAATNDRLTKLGKYIFRTCFENSQQARAMAKFAQDAGFMRVAILIDPSHEYSSNLGQAFETEFQRRSGAVVTRQNISDCRDFSPQLRSIQEAKPDLLVLPLLHVEGAIAARNIRALGLKIPILGGDGWDTPDLVAWTDVIEGCYFITHFPPETEDFHSRRFAQNYQTLFGTSGTALSALAHDALLVLGEALRNTEKPAKIRENLLGIRDFPVATGMFSFSRDRNPRKHVFVTRVEKGKFVPCAIITN